MDIVFKCNQCGQELSVEEAAAGVEIECPSCGHHLTVPAAQRQEVLNPMATSAAARAEQPHFKVPTYEKAPAPAATIEKPLQPLEAAAKTSDKQIRVKTLRHSDHIEVGRDLFDDHVSQILQKIGEQNIINITPVVYTHMDLATRQWISDYGVFVVYRG